MEIWKDIIGFENSYQVSSYGRIKSLKRHWKLKETLLSLQKSIHGYLGVRLGKGASNYKEHKVHRLVAIHFIDNPNNYKEVNHIDGNKENNHHSNLEWCSRSYNMKHAFHNKLASISDEQRLIMSKNAKRRIGFSSTNGKKVINIQTNEIYPTAILAAKSINMKVVTLVAMLNGRNPNKTNLKYF